MTNYQRKKLVKATTMDELIKAAKLKLALTEDNYKIYTQDYCEVDDEEILTDLAENSNDHLLLLTLVPNGIPWNSDVSNTQSTGLKGNNLNIQSTTSDNNKLEHQISQTSILDVHPSTSTNQCNQLSTLNDQSSASTKQSSQSSSLTRQIKDINKIFPKLNTKLQKALETHKFLGYDEKKRLIHVIEEYMVNDLENTSLGVANSICEQIVDKYPDSFKIKIGNQDLKGTSKSLAIKLYNRIHYTKRGQDEGSLSKSHVVNDLNASFTAPKPQDEYGCVAYLPNLTLPETWESQEEKRSKLFDSHKSGMLLNDDIEKSMVETYCFQRKCLHNDKDLSKFFQDWPYFKHPKVIIAHANEFLGKNTMTVWKESLQQLSKQINCLTRDNEIIASKKYSKKMKDAALPPELTCVRQQIKEAKQFCDVLKNEDPYSNIVFDFIVKYMGGKEDITYLYLVIEEEIDDDELLEAVKVSNPVLIIRGKNIHESSNLYDVVIDKEIVIRVSSFLDGILITFLSYYIFAIVYPPEIEGTLETIQRLFFKIDPPKGTKRGGKRKATVQHPKLTKFLEELHQYNGDNYI